MTLQEWENVLITYLNESLALRFDSMFQNLFMAFNLFQSVQLIQQLFLGLPRFPILKDNKNIVLAERAQVVPI